jgi:hypothetical protein
MQFSELQRLIEKTKLPLLQYLQKSHPEGSGDWIDYTCREIYLKYIRLSPENSTLNQSLLLKTAQEEIALQKKENIF